MEPESFCQIPPHQPEVLIDGEGKEPKVSCSSAAESCSDGDKPQEKPLILTSGSNEGESWPQPGAPAATRSGHSSPATTADPPPWPQVVSDSLTPWGLGGTLDIGHRHPTTWSLPPHTTVPFNRNTNQLAIFLDNVLVHLDCYRLAYLTQVVSMETAKSRGGSRMGGYPP